MQYLAEEKSTQKVHLYMLSVIHHCIEEMNQGDDVKVHFSAKVQKDNGDGTFDLTFEDGGVELGMKKELIHFITDVEVELSLSVTIVENNGDGTYDVRYACGKVEKNINGELIHKSV